MKLRSHEAVAGGARGRAYWSAMLLIRDRHPADPVFEMAVTEALVRAVAAGTVPEAARVFRPGPTMAFGRRDALLPGFQAAARAARAAGYAPVVRLGGGHAAGYDEGSLVVELITTQERIGIGIQERFAAAAAVLEDALRAVGIEPVTGELPGEYCPGRWSLHAAGTGVKLAGLAQRSIRGAALTTAFMAVQGGERLRTALTAVYRELAIPWDPATAGAAEDVRPGVRVQDVETAIVDALRRRRPLTEGEVDDEVRARAQALEGARHRAGAVRT
ncbi:MAG: lipoate--protein ligase family protein [Solirubrobacterales bacterium]|nr:lipoate--protein ligase family protein [Solirubrobacterales bacterium]